MGSRRLTLFYAVLLVLVLSFMPYSIRVGSPPQGRSPVVNDPMAASSFPASMPAGAAIARYTSVTNGYALSYPRDWVRLSHIHWTPDGPAADFTAMRLDHEAAIGVVVAPTGAKRYADSDLRLVADDFIRQQDTVQGNHIRHSVLTINQVRYSVATTTFRHGGETQSDSWMVVLTTAQRRRLYLFAGLVYDCTIHFPQGGGEGDQQATAIPTDVPIDGSGYVVAPVRDGGAGGLATPEAGGPAGAAPRPSLTPVAAPRSAPAAPAAARGPAAARLTHDNSCGALALSGLDVVKVNPFYGAERLLAAASLRTVSLDARLADDRQPAPAVGVDGFARFADPATGFGIGYPAQWQPIPNPGAIFTVRAPDKKATVSVRIQPTGGRMYSAGDLQAIADHQIYQVGQVLGTISHRAVTLHGAMAVVADAPLVDIGFAQSRVTAKVAVYHRRIYASVAWVFHAGADSSDFSDVQAAFFAPYDVYARAAGWSFVDTHNEAEQLALAALDTVFIDPRVANDQHPAPAVEVDGFARHTSAAYGYSLSYPGQWKPTAKPGTDLAVVSKDKHVVLTVVVQPTGGKTYTVDDLKTVAARQIAQIGQGGTATYTTLHHKGNTYLLASVADLTTPAADFGSVTGDVVALATVQHRRVYLFAGWVYQFSSDPGSLDFAASKQNEQLLDESLGTITL